MKQETKFKQTEIGMIPEEWEIRNLGDIVMITTGKLDSNCARDNGIYPFFTCAPEPLKIDDYVFDCKAILLAGNNANGVFHLNFYKGKFNAYQRTYVLTSKEGVDLNLRFLYYQLNLRLNYFKEISQGTATRFLTMRILDDLEIDFPSLPEQTAIAKILSDLDSKIELLQKQNKTLEAIGQAIFKHWFVDFEFPNEEDKPYKSSGGEMVDSELGEIPKGWETDSLRYTIDYYIGGGWGEETKNNDFEIEAFVIRGTDIPSVKEGNVKNIPLRYHKKSNYDKRVLKNKDIVLEISGGSKGQPVGRSFLVNDRILKQLNDKAICASFCKVMRVKDKFSPFYISLLLNKIYENEDIMKYQLQSTGISNFNFEYFLDDVKILKIPNYITIEFNEILERIFNKKNQNGYEDNTLSKTRDLLLPKLMSGKIRVPVEVE